MNIIEIILVHLSLYLKFNSKKYIKDLNNGFWIEFSCLVPRRIYLKSEDTVLNVLQYEIKIKRETRKIKNKIKYILYYRIRSIVNG